MARTIAEDLDKAARTTEVVHREGKAIAMTTEANGYDAKPVTVSEVRKADFKRMQHLEAANVVIDLPPYTAY